MDSLHLENDPLNKEDRSDIQLDQQLSTRRPLVPELLISTTLARQPVQLRKSVGPKKLVSNTLSKGSVSNTLSKGSVAAPQAIPSYLTEIEKNYFKKLLIFQLPTNDNTYIEKVNTASTSLNGKKQKLTDTINLLKNKHTDILGNIPDTFEATAEWLNVQKFSDKATSILIFLSKAKQASLLPELIKSTSSQSVKNILQEYKSLINKNNNTLTISTSPTQYGTVTSIGDAKTRLIELVTDSDKYDLDKKKYNSIVGSYNSPNYRIIALKYLKYKQKYFALKNIDISNDKLDDVSNYTQDQLNYKYLKYKQKYLITLNEYSGGCIDTR